uniref:NYN domain-containing protein n=1 Tax=Plectus sambesii TaxID=2011161 RepID=A0A914WPN2_9BILA
MATVRYYWDTNAIPAPKTSGESAQYAFQKLRNKFGSGEFLVVGDQTRQAESGDITLDMNTIPLVNFIHVPNSQRKAGSKILLDKIKEAGWKKGDIIVLLTVDNGLISEIMKLKTKGVVVNLVENQHSQLKPISPGDSVICHFSIVKDCMSEENYEKLKQHASKLHEAACRVQTYQWADILL